MRAPRWRFDLLRPSDSTESVSFATVTQLWGSLSGLTGIESPAIQARADHRIRFRYRSDLTPRDRLQMGDRVFEITSVVDPDGRRRMLDVLVSEMV